MTRLLTAPELAKQFSLPSEKWPLARARANAIPYIKLGHYTRFSADEIALWLASPRGKLVPRAGADGMTFVVEEAAS